MVQLLAKSIKPFRSYRIITYLTFEFDLWPCDQGHQMCFLCSFFKSFYMVQYLAKSAKPIRIYHKFKIFDFWFWPLGQGPKCVFFKQTFDRYYMAQFLAKFWHYVFGPNLHKIWPAIYEKNRSYSNKKKNNNSYSNKKNTNKKYRARTVAHYSSIHEHWTQYLDG